MNVRRIASRPLELPSLQVDLTRTEARMLVMVLRNVSGDDDTLQALRLALEDVDHMPAYAMYEMGGSVKVKRRVED